MAAITLAEANNNAQTDLDVAVINEFRKESAILDSLIFDQAVNPSGGGATLTYGYRRQITQRGAAFREINTEYQTESVETKHFTVGLSPLGGAFAVDRVTRRIGPEASGAVALNMSNLVTATATKFQDSVINGDTAVEEHGFDGLDKALVDSATEFRAGQVTDWTDFDTNSRAEHVALDAIDEFLGLLDGTPTVLVGNQRALARVRAAVRRAGMYTKDPVEGLVGQNGRPITRESYGGLLLVDAGAKAGSNDLIIPIQTRTVGGVATTGLTDLFAYRVGLDGFHAVATTGSALVESWLPDHSTAGAVKNGEVEMGPVAVALKATKAAAVFRNIKVGA